MVLSYLLVELILFVISIFVHYYFKVKLFSSKKQFFMFWIFALIIGVIWDHYAIVSGHWLYPETGVLGWFIWDIPIEDYLFMIVVPYFILITYRLFRRKMFS